MLKSAIQDNRQLAIFTSLGKDTLLLESFNGEESLSELSRFDLNLLSADPKIDPADILGRNVTFLVGSQDLPTRFFNGYVSEFAQTDATDRGIAYRATVVPWLWFLTQTSDCRIFQDKNVPQIVQQIFDDLGFQDYDLQGLRGDYPPLEYCVQYRESDFQFVSRLMEEMGIFYFFRHENGKHTLVLGDSTASYFAIDDADVSIAKGTQQGIRPSDLFQWQQGKQLLAGRWIATDFNFAEPRRKLTSEAPSRVPSLQRFGLERFDYPGRFAESQLGLQQVHVRMEEEEAKHEWVSAEGVRHTFTPGGLFRVTSHPRATEQGKQYVLRRVVYRAGSVGGYTTGGGNAEQPWLTQFDAMPHATVVRPERRTVRPIVEGPQTAVVVGPAGEEIHTDEHGRIKVQFHWDREGARDERSSCWMRVSQTHAGAGWGAMDIPRIGEEVIVSFLEGDPDRPIVKGRVYNAAARAPFGLPGQMTRSGGKSNTHKGSGYNELSMDDSAGEEQMRVNAQHNMDTTVGNSQTLKVGVDRSASIGSNDALTIGSNQTVEIGKDWTERVGTHENIIAGNDIVFDAGVAITLKCGASKIHMNQAGMITVSGQFISSLARATNSIIAPMTEIVGSVMLNQAGLICLDVGGVKHIKAKQTTVSGSTVNVDGGGMTIIKGKPIKLGEAGMATVSLPMPSPAAAGAAGAAAKGAAGTGSASGAANTPQKKQNTNNSVAGNSSTKAPESSKDQDPDKSVGNSTQAAPPQKKIDELKNSTGKLNPDLLKTPTDRAKAYEKHQELNELAGGEYGKTKFAKMASEVSDDFDGLLARGLMYSDKTEKFLNEGNRRLYEFNDKIFNDQRQTPNELNDPYAIAFGADENSQKITSAIDYDLRMVQTEQRFLSDVMKDTLPEDNKLIIDEINSSLKSLYPGPNLVKYLGGRLLGYETKAALGASLALGRNPDFSNESDRIAIGYAEAFLAHGYSEQEYLDFMKSGEMPRR